MWRIQKWGITRDRPNLVFAKNSRPDIVTKPRNNEEPSELSPSSYLRGNRSPVQTV
jgi:hypothetical protein